jgi:hypothetical protein
MNYFYCELNINIYNNTTTIFIAVLLRMRARRARPVRLPHTAALPHNVAGLPRTVVPLVRSAAPLLVAVRFSMSIFYIKLFKYI